MGAFVLMGSGEFLPWAEEADRWAFDASGVGGDRVLVCPAASAPEGEEVFAKWARMGVEHYEGMGMRPEVLEIRTRRDAEDASLVTALEGARYLFFSGGNPAVLVETLEGTPAWRAIVERVDAGMSLGGCSAGMVALGVLAPDTRRFGRRSADSNHAWVPALRFFADAFFGAHWDQLDAYSPGLMQLVLDAWPQDSVLFALDEDTAAYGDGERWTVGGKGGLTIPGQDGLERVVAGGEALVPLTRGSR